MNARLQISIIIFTIFFLAGVFSIPNYGISWDEPEHYHRGQAYLWYFLTSERTYASLPRYDLKRAQIDKNYHQRSIYQSDSLDFNYWIENDGDHPVLNDILASLFNYIFYQKLGMIDDVHSYHLFEIFIASIAVASIFYFGCVVFNLWVGLFAALILATYPLFWSESHFNIKDPIETTFFTITIYFFWKAISSKRAKFVLVSALFAGFAFATKFNILFLPIILISWLLLRQIFIDKNTINILFSRRFFISFILFPAIMYGIFVISWPYIWQDVVGNTLDVFKYYEMIGLESKKIFSPLNLFNPFALKWFFYTIQPLVLIYFILSFIKYNFNKTQKDVFVLWLFWFLVPLSRVSFEGATIYGGIRQIMEFIPALALISGIGVRNLIESIISYFRLDRNTNTNTLYSIAFLISAIILISTLVRLHPNENTYFNVLSGGLKKNYDLKFPSAGITLGNTYKQGVDWINENAPPNSKLALVQGTTVNIPAYWVRSDIAYSNYHWSGINRNGEYLMELVHIYDVKVYFYAWDYVETMLEPVYQVIVDGVPILKIWKNDLAHTKKEFQKIEYPYSNFQLSQTDTSIKLTLGDEVMLSRLIIKYDENNECSPVKYGTVFISLDNKNFHEEGDKVPYDQLGRTEEIEPNSFRYMFTARKAKYIDIKLEPNSCALINPSAEIIILK